MSCLSERHRQPRGIGKEFVKGVKGAATGGIPAMVGAGRSSLRVDDDPKDAVVGKLLDGQRGLDPLTFDARHRTGVGLGYRFDQLLGVRLRSSAPHKPCRERD